MNGSDEGREQGAGATFDIYHFFSRKDVIVAAAAVVLLLLYLALRVFAHTPAV